MKLRIVSDGTTTGTHVTTVGNETLRGEELSGVQEVTWRLVIGGKAEVTLRIRNVEVDVQGEGSVPTADMEGLEHG